VIERCAGNTQQLRGASLVAVHGRQHLDQMSLDSSVEIPVVGSSYRDRLFHILDARFVAADLSDALATPALSALRRVTWARYAGRRPVDFFIADPDGDGLVDQNWTPVHLDRDATIGIPHPAEFSATLRDPWGVVFADNEVVELFPQLDREVAVATRDLPYHEIERDVPHWDLSRFLFREGWTRDYESRSFELMIRGSVLGLTTRLAGGDLRHMERLWLKRPQLDRKSAEDDIVYSEAIAASVKLLDTFAPSLI